VRLMSSYAGKFRAPMDLRDFPFDRQVLPIYVESSANIEDLTFDGGMEKKARRGGEQGWPADPRNVLSDRVRLPEWDIEEIRVRHTPEYYGFINQSFSRFRIEIHVARRPAFYVWKIIAIEALLVILSWVVFLLDPANLGDRATVAVTLLLATVAFSYVVGGITPRISYLTLLDDFLLGSFFLIFLASAESAVVFRLYRRGEGRAATRIDRWSLLLFPVGYLLFNALLWARVVAAYLS
jgi:Neurotransmitter-gated ion-channel transmembrane region